LTGFRKIKAKQGWVKQIHLDFYQKTGLGTPFINVSLSGLLWGYNDELPCMKLKKPDHCPLYYFDDVHWSDYGEDEWGDDDWKRKKRETGRSKADTVDTDLRGVYLSSTERPNAEYIDCKCQWGLFRARNNSVRISYNGRTGFSKKGFVKDFDILTALNWWKPGSECDKAVGLDSSKLHPGWKKNQSFNMFISHMCRRYIILILI
jgi:hypothetical protein